MRKYINTVRENVAMYNLLGSETNGELQEILGVLIGPSATPELCGRLASYGIVELAEMSIEEFQEHGLSELKALELHAAFLLADKLKSSIAEKGYIIRSPLDAANYLKEQMRDLKQEHVVIVMVNSRHEVIARKTIFVGGLAQSIIHPREIFKEAVRKSASSIFLYHNHPSGDLLSRVNYKRII